ncbi:DUF2064 domain-containing protein [Maribacter sp. HTCC2170]|uniref:TIGR04282 family arsenosugar biosynthesis glycosyltransferase n=1 Tax=Maribacter sp. (strain HTCC2170 / KCCM 42371) TaxID=313603 RepID=UPI00006BD4F0|nr:DUF2064 domain-containing protein [Maribacter sp. HTCC2170]EAR02755.1 hypothetical protein FB2170_05690 [Maribacter sp. HTCC2170]
MRAPITHKTAILVFALSPHEEMRRKKINGAGLLFSTLSAHTLNTVKKTALPYFYLTEKEQNGISFGERFTNAFQFVYDKGFDQVIAIGNDTPHLNASQIIRTADILSEEKVVLGPSTDGGFYLLGMHKVNFNQKSFKSLPWKTMGLNGQFINEFITVGVELIQLKRLKDIDDSNDIRYIISYTTGLPIQVFRILLAIIRQNPVFYKFGLPLVESHGLGLLHNRGSPIQL